MSAWIIAVVFAAVAFVLGFLLHHLYRQMELKKKVGLKKDEAEIIIENARKEAEKVRIQGELKAKEIVEKRTSEIE
ncbi:MAG: Rnase Y domain-containing protein, partial [Candidatus Dadabacteria bacterium]